MIRAKHTTGLVFFPAFDWAISPTHPEREERLLYTQDQVFEEGLLDIEGIHELTADTVTKEDIRIAVNTLFTSGQKVGAFHNATYPSKFRVSDVSFEKSTGTAVITLSGSYVKPADRCEGIRYREQVWATARHFPEVNRVTIWLENGKLLGDLLYAVTSKKP